MTITTLPGNEIGTANTVNEIRMAWNYHHEALMGVASGPTVVKFTRAAHQTATWDMAQRISIPNSGDDLKPYICPFSGFVISHSGTVNDTKFEKYDISSGTAVLVTADPRTGSSLPSQTRTLCEAFVEDTGKTFLLSISTADSNYRVYETTSGQVLNERLSYNPPLLGSTAVIVCDLPASGNNPRWLVRDPDDSTTIRYNIITYNVGAGTGSETTAFSLSAATQVALFGAAVEASPVVPRQFAPPCFIDRERNQLIIYQNNVALTGCIYSAINLSTFVPNWSVGVDMKMQDGSFRADGNFPNDIQDRCTVLIGEPQYFPARMNDFAGPFTYDQAIQLINLRSGQTISAVQTYDGNLSSPLLYSAEGMVVDGTTGNIAVMGKTTSAITSYAVRMHTLEGIEFSDRPTVNTVTRYGWYIRRGVAERAAILTKGPTIDVVNANAELIQQFLSELVDANPSDDYHVIECDIDLNGHTLLNLNEDVLDGLRHA